MAKKAPVVSFHLVGGRPLGRFPPCRTESKSKIVRAGVSGACEGDVRTSVVFVGRFELRRVFEQLTPGGSRC